MIVADEHVVTSSILERSANPPNPVREL